MSRKPKTASPATHPFAIVDEALHTFEAAVDAATTREAQQTVMSRVVEFLFKKAAHRLRKHLATSHDVNITVAQSLNAISASVGAKDWSQAQQGAADLVARGFSQAGDSTAPTPVADASGLEAPQQVSHALDPSRSQLVVGVAGCGKSMALVLRLGAQVRRPAAGRPILLATLNDGGHYQFGWKSFCNHARTILGDSLLEVPSSLDSSAWAQAPSKALVAYLAEGPWESRRHGNADALESLAASRCIEQLEAWCAQGLKPIFVLEEANYVFGLEGLSLLLARVPNEVTILMSAQSFHDLPPELILRTFDDLILMRTASFGDGRYLRDLVSPSVSTEAFVRAAQELQAGMGHVVTLPAPARAA